MVGVAAATTFSRPACVRRHASAGAVLDEAINWRDEFTEMPFSDMLDRPLYIFLLGLVVLFDRSKLQVGSLTRRSVIELF